MIDNWTEDRQRLLREAALDYAEQGWAVVPLHTPHPDLGCTCQFANACKSPGKHPRTKHGLSDASTDVEEIELWWRLWPAANIGLITGEEFDVLDIDGPAALAALQARQVGDWLFGPKVSTGRGWHIYLQPHWHLQRDRDGNERQVPQRNRSRVLPGVDYLGHNGYVVAPPSSHVSGTEYRWLAGMHTPLEPVPEWLAQVLNPPMVKVERKPTLAARVSVGYAEKALREEARAVLSAGEGGRNHQLNRSAFNLGQLVADGKLERLDVEAVLRTAAERIGLDDIEITKTLRSGIESGMASPRTRGVS